MARRRITRAAGASLTHETIPVFNHGIRLGVGGTTRVTHCRAIVIVLYLFLLFVELFEKRGEPAPLRVAVTMSPLVDATNASVLI